MLRKLFICPWFGPLPVWMPHYMRNIERLKPLGYDFLIDTHIWSFKERVARILDIPDAPVVEGGSKIHDYRACLGLLYAQEIGAGGYDFYGHTDFDCVYGRVDRWLNDDMLDELDLHSNHDTYICGPWSLYRTNATETIYERVDDWREILEEPRTTGWVETSYSRAAEAALGERMRYTLWQTRDWNRFDSLHWDGPRLMEGNREVFMAHFRRLNPKVYPQHARL